MRHIYSEQQEIEKYLIKCNKKNIKDLRKKIRQLNWQWWR